MTIRKPNVDELDSVQALVQTVVNEVYASVCPSGPLPIEKEDWSLALIAIVDGSIAGIILTEGEWISDLWVLRENRRRGVGQKLLASGEAQIAARGCSTFRLRVVKSNDSAVRFYLRNGWQVKREFRHEKLPLTMLEMSKCTLKASAQKRMRRVTGPQAPDLSA